MLSREASGHHSPPPQPGSVQLCSYQGETNDLTNYLCMVFKGAPSLLVIPGGGGKVLKGQAT